MSLPATRLVLTALEDRTVLSSFAVGDLWPDPDHLTLSFAPDSAKVGDTSSALFKTLNKTAKSDDWQLEILRAFQTWVAVSNLNVGLVADKGDAFGTPGDVQDDTRFGDIRIGARPLSSDALANAVPFDWSVGTWSGDVLFNTATQFGIKPNQAGTYDLFTVAAHEAGHSFGLGHSDDPLSVLSESYGGTKPGLAASDVASIQALYGARQPDPFEGAAGNGTRGTATFLGSADISSATADLTTVGDVDYYQFTSPAKADKFTIRLQTAGLSLLTAKVTVYDANGQVVGAGLSTDPLRGDLEVKFDKVVANSSYTIRVESARPDVFGIGRYALSVVNKDAPTVKADPNDRGLNDTPATATVLVRDTAIGRGSGRGSDGTVYAGRLESKTDVDYYRVTAPADGGTVLVVRVSGTGMQKASPVVEVFDANMNRVAARIVGRRGSEMSVEVDGVVRGRDYFIRVRGNGSDAATGAYRLRTAFTGSVGSSLTGLLAGGLGGSATTASGQLSLSSSTLFQFDLNSAALGGTGGATVTLTVTDAKGKAVAQVTQTAGSGSTLLAAYLLAGEYTITASLTLPKGSPVLGVNFQLLGGVFSDPIGPLNTRTRSGPGTTGTSPPAPTSPTSPPTVLVSPPPATPLAPAVDFTFTPMNLSPVLSFYYSY